MLARVQVRTLPVTPQPATGEVMLHAMPEPAVPTGRVSVIETPVAVPGPVLVTVTVNPIGSPALTLAASAVLAMAMWAGSTVSTSALHGLTAGRFLPPEATSPL